MKTIVEIIEKSKEETANFKVHEVTKSLQNVLSILKNEKLFLVGEENGAHYKVPYSNVFYIEVVDKKSFIYTQDKVYQSAEKLYQLEEKLLPHKFIRIGKSMLLNIEVIQSVSPTLSGRFEATLVNDERVAVSRKYVPELKKALGMRKRI
ncbi:LytTR family DNA-binding domain-containing protein [Enterococcus raffinosus]|uniref:LytTR family DNA-binding domain-containing protein n=1 Tax=Enterococcus raffinosus TaxID=71452 RepID=UPI001C49506D|nr:LytTR family DNA-binding domain-containing protein [Enterococcus raffinosus]MDT2573971.1 LytTR family DNA-binding domain-containing protein [Enterococcus raffinosus]QXJ60284.1 LytTR family transcriptional regulator DNA-binding domain-containing protein [Enterococcus raffinosus]